MGRSGCVPCGLYSVNISLWSNHREPHSRQPVSEPKIGYEMKGIRPNRYVVFFFARRLIIKTIVMRLFIPSTEASDQIQHPIITLS
jgi:hypothetical protein